MANTCEFCKLCREWEKTRRPCTGLSHGDCDCPFCMGVCECHLAPEDRTEWGDEMPEDHAPTDAIVGP